MKLIMCFTTLMIVLTLNAEAQLTKNKELQLYGTVGMKVLQPKYFGHPTNISPSAVPTVGGGATWERQRFHMGAEFNYTDGKKQTDAYGTIFTGINFNLIAGYRWDLDQKLKLSLQSGFGYNLYHLSLTDKNYAGTANLNTAIYHNFMYTVPVSVMFQRFNSNGTFVGIKAGYNFNVMPNEWRYIEGPTTEIFTSSSEGLYFQIILGGLIRLNDRTL
jgi:hypothetical protein